MINSSLGLSTETIRCIKYQGRYMVWIKRGTEPPFGQGYCKFIYCAEGFCAVHCKLWTRTRNIFSFTELDDCKVLVERLKNGFTEREEAEYLLKRKLILGTVIDDLF